MSYSEELKPIFLNEKLSQLSAKQQFRVMNIFILEAQIQQLEWVLNSTGRVPALLIKLNSLNEQIFKLTNKYDSKTLYDHMVSETKLGR